MEKEHTAIFVLVALMIAASYFYFPSEAFSKKPAMRFEGRKMAESINVLADSADMADIPILIYHSVVPYYPDMTQEVKRFSVEPAMFERQMQYLQDHDYRVVSFDDYLRLPEKLLSKSVILTFDDGWENQYKYAFPILRQFHFPATFFVFTNAIDHEHYLSWPEIKEMSSAGMTIGNHTKSHPYLFRITDQDVLRAEIMESRKILEDNLGKPIDIFAYPFGRYSKEIIDFLASHGFRAARADGYEDALRATHKRFTMRGYEVENSMVQFVQVLHAGE